jgi:hypothetical protein
MNFLSGHYVDDCLLYAIPSDLNEDEFSEFTSFLLHEINLKTPDCLMLDYSSFQVMDHTEFIRCYDLVKQVEFMGTKVMNHGLSAGVVGTLVDLSVNFEGMSFFGSLESAIDSIKYHE